MIVWRTTGNEIGPQSSGAAYYPTKEKALKALREHRAWTKEQTGYADEVSAPTRIEVKNREDLCFWLNEATGFGGS